jgi:hypothetical protein
LNYLQVFSSSKFMFRMRSWCSWVRRSANPVLIGARDLAVFGTRDVAGVRGAYSDDLLIEESANGGGGISG